MHDLPRWSPELRHQPDDWRRLRVLLSERWWTKDQTVAVLAGLDPVYPMRRGPSNLASVLVWLPGCPRPEWSRLSSEQLGRRLFVTSLALETKLWGIPQKQTPYAWVGESLRGDWEPSWYRKCLEFRNLKELLPPEPDRMKHRRLAERRWANNPEQQQLRSLVRSAWEEWVLGEKQYNTREEFIRHIQETIDATHPDAAYVRKLIGGWMSGWEQEWCLVYGVSSPVNGRPYRTHGYVAVIRPFKGKSQQKRESDET